MAVGRIWGVLAVERREWAKIAAKDPNTLVLFLAVKYENEGLSFGGLKQGPRLFGKYDAR